MSSDSNYKDVKSFHQKFSMLDFDTPSELTQRKLVERARFLLEEFQEFLDGCGLIPVIVDDDGYTPIKALGKLDFTYYPQSKQNISAQADSLVDLVYVALGTASMLGLPWGSLWDDVHKCNMAKVRGETHRKNKVDVCKPEGWEPPKTTEILLNHGYQTGLKDLRDDRDDNE